jgi:uncharacterized DUF497 family protein
MQFEWDENKNAANLKKHGIDFDFASMVFDDTDRKAVVDNRRDYGETRFQVTGVVFGKIVFVAFTMRGSAARIISARFANKRERDEYNGDNQEDS